MAAIKLPPGHIVVNPPKQFFNFGDFRGVVFPPIPGVASTAPKPSPAPAPAPNPTLPTPTPRNGGVTPSEPVNVSNTSPSFQPITRTKIIRSTTRSTAAAVGTSAAMTQCAATGAASTEYLFGLLCGAALISTTWFLYESVRQWLKSR